MIARAPATTANLGPSFDCAGAALDLWNELTLEAVSAGVAIEIEGEGASELPRDETHLTLRAFSLLAPTEGYRFSFVNRIPLERGLGSSAAAIALGLVAGSTAAGGGHTREELLRLGVPLEGHTDNLAAALYGGVCVSWQRDGRVCAARIADDMPVTAVVALPTARQSTQRSRASLPANVTHADATANAGAATLLGAAIASGDATLLRDAFADRLHEPYRAAGAPLLDLARQQNVAGAVGVTLSGSGPSVIVWAEKNASARVADELARTLGDDTQVLPLAVAPEGATCR
jgi:homoserine kinase